MGLKPPYVMEAMRDGRLIRRRYRRKLGAGWFTASLPKNVPFTDPAFMRAYDAAARAFEQRKKRVPKKDPAGAVDVFIQRYLASHEFQQLGERTKKARINLLKRFAAATAANGRRVGDLSWAQMEERHARKIMWEFTPEVRRVLKQGLNAVAESAIDRGDLQHNVIAGIVVRTKAKGAKRKAGRHTWTAEEIAQYRARHAPGTDARIALDVLLFTGQRRGDAVTLGWHMVKDRVLRLTQEKTGSAAFVPVRDEFAAAVADLPFGGPWLRNANGSPWSSGDAFGNRFADWCEEAGLPSCCRAHGLRKAFCCYWAERGCSTSEIAAMSGHLTLAEVERYTHEVDRLALVRAVLERG